MCLLYDSEGKPTSKVGLSPHFLLARGDGHGPQCCSCYGSYCKPLHNAGWLCSQARTSVLQEHGKHLPAPSQAEKCLDSTHRIPSSPGFTLSPSPDRSPFVPLPPNRHSSRSGSQVRHGLQYLVEGLVFLLLPLTLHQGRLCWGQTVRGLVGWQVGKASHPESVASTAAFLHPATIASCTVLPSTHLINAPCRAVKSERAELPILLTGLKRVCAVPADQIGSPPPFSGFHDSTEGA